MSFIETKKEVSYTIPAEKIETKDENWSENAYWKVPISTDLLEDLD